jgi:hypothetical protein
MVKVLTYDWTKSVGDGHLRSQGVAMVMGAQITSAFRYRYTSASPGNPNDCNGRQRHERRLQTRAYPFSCYTAEVNLVFRVWYGLNICPPLALAVRRTLDLRQFLQLVPILRPVSFCCRSSTMYMATDVSQLMQEECATIVTTMVHLLNIPVKGYSYGQNRLSKMFWS